jgi:hypothetical protein
MGAVILSAVQALSMVAQARKPVPLKTEIFVAALSQDDWGRLF